MTNGTASETNGNNLALCPFCGGEAWLVEDSGVAFGWCPMCNVKTRPSTDERVAVERWNTRVAVTDHDFAMAVHDGNLWGKCSECKERQGYYLDAETIQRQQERIAKLTVERDAYFEMVKRVQADCDARDALIRDMWAGIVREHPQGGFPDMGLMEKRMRELGIDLDG